MKNFKLGFSLAEILIVLTIIAVISAMSLPNLINNHIKMLNATKLAKAVNQIELGIQNIIQKSLETSTDGSITTDLSLITTKDIGIDENDTSLTTDFKLFETGVTFLGLQKTNSSSEYIAFSTLQPNDTGLTDSNEKLFYMPKQGTYVIYSKVDKLSRKLNSPSPIKI